MSSPTPTPPPPPPPFLKSKLTSKKPNLKLPTNQPLQTTLFKKLLQQNLSSYLSLYSVISSKISSAALLSPSEITIIRNHISALQSAVDVWESAGLGHVSNIDDITPPKVAKTSQEDALKFYDGVQHELIALQTTIRDFKHTSADESARELSVEEEIARFGVRGKYLRMLKEFALRKGDRVLPLFVAFLTEASVSKETHEAGFVRWIVEKSQGKGKALGTKLDVYLWDLMVFVGGGGDIFESNLRDWMTRFAKGFLYMDCEYDTDIVSFLANDEGCVNSVLMNQEEAFKKQIESRIERTIELEFGRGEQRKVKLQYFVDQGKRYLTTEISAEEKKNIREQAIVLYVCEFERVGKLAGYEIMDTKLVSPEACEVALKIVQQFLREVLPGKYQSSGL
ncbi:hypothetical protein HK096_003598 [Nowakowskiella sp. JEL0078]|nr:hypothetical protein HK096_003598 [Nowakowskiella sp. JEL0078]